MYYETMLLLINDHRTLRQVPANIWSENNHFLVQGKPMEHKLRVDISQHMLENLSKTEHERY